MFRSKKEKKEGTTTGGTSNYQEKTTINKSNDGVVMTRQISTETSHVRSVTRQERSYSISHSSSAGNCSAFLQSSPSFSVSGPGSIFFADSKSSGNFQTMKADATPFNFGTARVPTYTGNRSTSWTTGSYPSRSRPPILPSIGSQSAAQNPTIAQSLPVTSSSVVPTYEHKGLRLGKALIINNIKFAGEKEERLGAEKDSKDLKGLLKEIGFEVEHKTDLKGKEIYSKVKSFGKSDFNNYDISLTVIMTHGNNLVLDGNKVTKVRGGFTQVAGVDNVVVSTDDIIEMFTTGNCHRSLHGKPKIFIFQCCRGDRDQEVRHDTIKIKEQRKEHSDVLIAFSTLPGYLSNRNPITGTWYIQSICDVFKRHHKVLHVEDMLKIVDSQLGNKHPQYTQTSTYENRGFKQCYFFKKSGR